MRSRLAVLLWLAAAPAAAGELLERVLAVVDGRALFLSDVRAVEHLDGIGRDEAVARLIDETLLYQEAFRLPQAAAPGGEAPPAEPDAALRRARQRRSVIARYVAFRFRPQVRIDDEAVRRAYTKEVGDEEGDGGFEGAAPAIRERLTAAEVARRVSEWVRDLRAAADIRYNPAEP